MIEKKERIIIFSSDDCAACERIKEKLKDIVEVIDVTTDEAKEIMYKMLAQGLKFYDIPQCVRETNGKYELCDVEELIENED